MNKYGKTILKYDPKCAGAQAYEKFAEEFLERINK